MFPRACYGRVRLCRFCVGFGFCRLDFFFDLRGFGHGLQLRRIGACRRGNRNFIRRAGGLVSRVVRGRTPLVAITPAGRAYLERRVQ